MRTLIDRRSFLKTSAALAVSAAAVIRRIAVVVCMVLGALVGALLVSRVSLVASLSVVTVVFALVAVAAYAAGHHGEADWQRWRDPASPRGG